MKIGIDLAENEASSKETKFRYGPIFYISSVGVCFTSVFITAFYHARGVARARGGTDARHPQCKAKEQSSTSEFLAIAELVI